MSDAENRLCVLAAGVRSAEDASFGRAGAAVRVVDMPRLTGGVLHTKFWLADGAHLYVGSANMDWRSLTQVSGLSRNGAGRPQNRRAP